MLPVQWPPALRQGAVYAGGGVQANPQDENGGGLFRDARLILMLNTVFVARRQSILH